MSRIPLGVALSWYLRDLITTDGLPGAPICFFFGDPFIHINIDSTSLPLSLPSIKWPQRVSEVT